MRNPFPSLLALLVMCSAGGVHAQTLLNDTFDRGTTTSPAQLVGSAPDTAQGSAAGNTWANSQGTATTGTTNGAGATLTSPIGQSINLTFEVAPAGSTWAANSLYTLTFSLPHNNLAQGGWFEVALANGLNGHGSVLGGIFQNSWSYRDPTTGNVLTSSTGASGLNNATTGSQFVITLNTATDLESFYEGTSATGTPAFTVQYNSSTLPSLSNGLYVTMNIFGTSNTETYGVNSVSVTESSLVPEPPALVMAALGLMVLSGFWFFLRRQAVLS